MTLTTHIRQKIERLPEGKPFGYKDLDIANKDYSTAAKALERLQKKQIIKRISRGQFYKPQKTVFGELKPDESEILRPYLFENGKRIAYETGTMLYNRLGLTTQIAIRTKIASRGKRISINRGSLKADPVKSYAEVTEKNFEILGLLDAFKDAKKIPDSSIMQTVKRLKAILRELTSEQKKSLVKYARCYPPRGRALTGAVLQNMGYPGTDLEPLKESLNPFTTIKLGLKKNELPAKKEWNIE